MNYSQSTPFVHVVLEWLAYFVGARVYFRMRRKSPIGLPLTDQLLLLACTLFGAAAGAVGLHIAESWAFISRQPMTHWISGKSVLGGLLGGTIGTETAKRALKYKSSTGDAWVPALVVGLVIGRIGCQLSGTWDMTYGSPTGTSWGWNYGDGVPRFPTALIELLAVLAIWAVLRARRWPRPGQMFNAFLLAYCLLRFLVEFLKPPFGAAAPGALQPGALQSGVLQSGVLQPGTIPVDRFAGLTAIQWAALAGAAWMWARIHASRRTSRG